MNKIIFEGTCTACITPFCENGIDYSNLKKQLEFQIENGINAVALLGTTGENPTVTDSEYEYVAKFAYQVIAGRTKFILGSGSNSTSRAIYKSQLASRCGADALLVVTPFYNKCTQKGLVQYYTDVCQNIDLPVICYNVPSRTGVNISPQTMGEIADIPNVSGIKEASGNLTQISQTAKYIKNKVALYSGDDSLTFDILSIGGKGVISVLSNVLPRQTRQIYDYYKSGDVKKAKKISDYLLPFMKALFLEVNPIPVKKAMRLMGLDSGILRPPLTQLEQHNQIILEKILKRYDITLKE